MSKAPGQNFSYTLPRTIVGPHEYTVDLYNGELRSVSDPTKTIDVFKMERENGIYWFWYNEKEMKQEIGNEWAFRECLPVYFDPFKADPDFYKRVGEESREQEKIIRSGQSHYDRPYDQRETLKEDRLPRLLPMVSIYGTEFFMDMRLNEFRQKDHPANKIDFRQMSIDEFHYVVFFDTATKNAFQGTYEQARRTDSVKQIILPPLDLMIRDGVKRHEQMLRKEGEFAEKPGDQTSRSRKKGMGI